MARIDVKKNTIVGKVVYYGPGRCGKTTNLEHINKTVPNSQEMMSLSTEGDRTIFFDFLPMELGKIQGISTTFKLYTVPGQVQYNLTRKMVLKDVDGLVFVADSQSSALQMNIESLDNLFQNLRELGMNGDDVPLVLQYNKRDLPDVLPREELDKALNLRGYPVVLASAMSGEGVFETLREISKLVFNKFSVSLGKDQRPAAAKPAAPAPAAGDVHAAAGPALDALAKSVRELDQKVTTIAGQAAKISEALTLLAQHDEVTRKHQQKFQESLEGVVTKLEVEELRAMLHTLLKEVRAGRSGDKTVREMPSILGDFSEPAPATSPAQTQGQAHASAPTPTPSISETLAGVPAGASAESATPPETPKAEAPAPAPAADDPQQANAARVARVMVADLNLYHAQALVDGIKAGDVYERLKEQFDEMRKTYEMRIPEEVRARKDFLKEAIDTYILKKRKDLGLE